MRKPFIALWSLFLAACGVDYVNPDASPAEQAAWERARALDTPESYIAFLEAFPNGAYVTQAARELELEVAGTTGVTRMSDRERTPPPAIAY